MIDMVIGGCSVSLASYAEVMVFVGLFEGDARQQELQLLGQWLQDEQDRKGNDEADICREGDDVDVCDGGGSITVVWTDADSYIELTDEHGMKTETNNLASLFEGGVKAYVFKKRTSPDLCTPHGSLKSEMVDTALLSDLSQLVQQFQQQDPVDPLTGESSIKGQSKYLIDYGMLNITDIEARYPEVTKPMCDGKDVCEIDRRENLTPEEFYERYYLWGKSVVFSFY